MNPLYFEESDFSHVDYDDALSRINRVLKQHRLELLYDDETEAAKLRSVDGNFVSTAHSTPESVRRITFSPAVFKVPNEQNVQGDLVAVMMPFDAGFRAVLAAIRKACAAADLRCTRADDVWVLQLRGLPGDLSVDATAGSGDQCRTLPAHWRTASQTG